MVDFCKTLLISLAGAASLALPGTAISAVAPKGPVNIYVGANPGGGYDRTARAIQKVVEEDHLLNVPLNISYHPGGGGAVAWTALNRYPGDMDVLSVFSPNIITNHLLTASPISYKSVTMLATLAFEDGCFAVNPKGRIKTAQDLVNALKTDPQHLQFGFGIAAGNQWHVAMALLAKAVGGDITKVRATVFGSGAQARIALQGMHTEVDVSGCATFAAFTGQGNLRIVAIAAPKRASGTLANIPTWKDLGYNVVWGAWRGVLGPRGLKSDQIKFWDDKLRAVVKSPQWGPVAAANYWRTDYLDHQQTDALMQRSDKKYREALTTLGLLH